MLVVPTNFKLISAFPNLSEFTREEGIELLKKCEYAARISHRTEDRITQDSYDRFLRSVVLNHGDLSVIEHATVSVEIEVDRGITHEIVRHRLAAYTQESTRFVNYSKGEGIRFIVPPFTYEESLVDWKAFIKQSEMLYNILIERGEKPELARSILPMSLASKLMITYNLRSWRHFFIMRTAKEAHPQMRELSIPLLREFQDKIPVLFEDIEPNKRQSEAMRLLR